MFRGTLSLDLNMCSSLTGKVSKVSPVNSRVGTLGANLILGSSFSQLLRSSKQCPYCTMFAMMAQIAITGEYCLAVCHGAT